MNELIRKMMLYGRAFARGGNGKWIDVWEYIHDIKCLFGVDTWDYFAHLKSNGYSSLYFCGWLHFYKGAPLCQLLGLGGRMWVAEDDEIYELYGEKLDAMQRKLSHADYRDDLRKRNVALICIVPMEGERSE